MSEQTGGTGSIAADFSDRADFANADRGFVGTLEPMVIRAADGRAVWDMDSWGFLDGDCPDTVNASLWRQAQLTAKHGLYEVTDGIYQVRGLEMSNMTLVESDHGVIVIDPLISREVAAAAIALYRRHRGDRAVTAVIYTHAHLDHFGGVLGPSASATWAGTTPTPRTCGSTRRRLRGHGTCRPSAASMRQSPRRGSSSTRAT